LCFEQPTNHLDLETTDALIEGIRAYQGAVLLVSHDQHLLASVCKDLLVVEKGCVESSSKDAFNEYKKAIVLGRR
jgi:ATP-binding cassette subfamily F protein 3